MKNKRVLFIICLAICILFAISSVNAGIFEFVEDTGDDSDDVNSFDDDIDEDKDTSVVKKGEIKEFKIKKFHSKQVYEKEMEIQDKIDDKKSDDFETVFWLNDYHNDYILKTADKDYLVMKESDSEKISEYDDYSYCIIECEVVDSHHGDDADYYFVKNIDVIKKVERKSETKSTESYSSESSTQSSESYSTSQSSQSYSSESINEEPSVQYIGNANTGKFHSTSCRDVGRINPSNIVNLYSRDEAISNGYSPCGHCRP